jgi:hypothetical protein
VYLRAPVLVIAPCLFVVTAIAATPFLTRYGQGRIAPSHIQRLIAQDYLGTKALGLSASLSFHVYLRTPVFFIGPLGRAINARIARRGIVVPDIITIAWAAVCRAPGRLHIKPGSTARGRADCALVKIYAHYH